MEFKPSSIQMISRTKHFVVGLTGPLSRINDVSLKNPKTNNFFVAFVLHYALIISDVHRNAH
jgi:hypothetical protein